jgi:hypothetical protein
MMHILLAVVLGTLLALVPFWRSLVGQRRDWQREQARRQDRLMREDVESWSNRVAWSLATTGKSYELDLVRPLPRPTFLHRGAPGVSWLFALSMWGTFVLICWMVLGLVVPAWQLPLPGERVVSKSVAEWQALCAETWARLPEEIPACCRRLTGVPCPVPGR